VLVLATADWDNPFCTTTEHITNGRGRSISMMAATDDLGKRFAFSHCALLAVHLLNSSKRA